MAHLVKILVLLLKMSKIIPFSRIIQALVLRILHFDRFNILGVIKPRTTILKHP